MPIFRPAGPDDGMLRATGDLAFSEPSAVRLESAMPSSYVLDGLGVATESEPAVPVYEAGDFIPTSMGDIVAVNDSRVLEDGSVQAYVYTATNVGVEHLVTIGSEQPTTEANLTESSSHVDPLTDTDSTAPIAFGEPLLPEQSTGGEISIGTSFEFDPGSVVEGIASAVATFNTGEEEIQAS